MLLRIIKRQYPLHLMLVPAIVLTLIYSYIPMTGIVMAFQKYQASRGIFGSEWIGWGNFEYVMRLPNTFTITWNTLYISTLKIAFGLLIPITVSLLLNEIRNNYFVRSVQTLIYLPHFLSWVILGGILIDVLSPSQGIINQILQLFGFKSIYFLGNNTWFPVTLVISDVWKEFGFSTIVYLAALTSINPTLYEAAWIDGAGRWRQVVHITLPGMLPIIVLMTTLSLGNVLNAGFDQVFNLYSPQVYQSGDIIDTFVYRIGLLDAKYGVATAVGLIKSFISLLLISVSYWAAYRLVNYRIF